jgi:selenocysteine lyase/cysteine desulfurase
MFGNDTVYVDNAGAARPTKQQLAHVARLVGELQLANPHSRNAASRHVAEVIEQARHRCERDKCGPIDYCPPTLQDTATFQHDP